MKRRCLALLLTMLAAVLVNAQQSLNWRWVAPSEEEFTVLMPGSMVRGKRTIPFSANMKLEQPAYESSVKEQLFMVLSFEQWRPGHPVSLKTLDTFAEGFQYAVLHAMTGDGNSITQQRDFTLNGHAGREYRLKIGERAGSARVYAANEHFYVALVLGDNQNAEAMNHFFDSFALAPRNTSETSRNASSPNSAEDLSKLVRVDPQSPWPAVEQRTRTAPISGGVLNGKAVSKPAPVYPAIARAARAQGTVTVQVLVDEEGKVVSASAVSGHPLLQQAAVDAARQARFSQTWLSGQAVKVSGVVTYNFILDTKPDDSPSRKF